MERVFVTLILVIAFGSFSSLDSAGSKPTPDPATQDPLRPTVSSFPSSGGTADSNNDMIAVTGVDITGASVMYLVDTKSRQIAAYQAVGGSGNGRKIYLVGARCIDYDLQLRGYNDESEYSWRDLDGMFDRIGSGEDPDSVKGRRSDLRLGGVEGERGDGREERERRR